MDEILVRLKVSTELYENKGRFLKVIEDECVKYGLDVDEMYTIQAGYEGDDFVMNRLTVIVTQSKNKV